MSTQVPDPESFITGGMSDVGRVRTVNKDYCDEFFDETTGRRLLILADGMGGHRGGEVASRMAVEAIGRVFEAEANQSELRDPEGLLAHAFGEASGPC